ALAAGESGWIPETLLRAKPAGDGPRLLAMMRGVEGQVWREGGLRASQWWPAPPDAATWRRFLRAAGLATGDDTVPEPETLPWADRSCADRPAGLPGSPAALERVAWVAGAGIVALGL